MVYLGAGIELIGVTALQMQVDAFINRWLIQMTCTLFVPNTRAHCYIGDQFQCCTIVGSRHKGSLQGISLRCIESLSSTYTKTQK